MRGLPRFSAEGQTLCVGTRHSRQGQVSARLAALSRPEFSRERRKGLPLFSRCRLFFFVISSSSSGCFRYRSYLSRRFYCRCCFYDCVIVYYESHIMYYGCCPCILPLCVAPAILVLLAILFKSRVILRSINSDGSLLNHIDKNRVSIVQSSKLFERLDLLDS